LNALEHKQLLERIPREAWHQVKVKPGRTNGRLCVHIRDTQPKDQRRASTTIYSLGEWLVHPLNKLNKPSAKREQSLDEYIQDSAGRLLNAALETELST